MIRLITKVVIISLLIEIVKLNAQIPDHEKLAESYKQYYRNQLQTSISPPSDSNVTILGRWGWGPCNDVKVQGDYAYIGNGSLFQVLDVSDPFNPTIAGEILTESTIREIDISGQYAYVLNPFMVIDISEPASPQIVSSQTVGNYAPLKLTVDGNYAYIGDFQGYMYIFDITNPTQPTQLSRVHTSGDWVVAIAVQDPYLFVQTTHGFAVDIFDISDKTQPVLINQYFTAGLAGGLAVEKDYLYLGTSHQPEFEIVNVSDPYNPQFMGGLDLPRRPTDITVRDTLAYLSMRNEGFYVINVSDKTNPVVKNYIKWTELNLPNDAILGPLLQSITGNYAYLASLLGLWIVDLQNLDSLTTTSFFPTCYVPYRAVVQNDYVYMAALYSGMKVIDVSNPTSPQLAGYFNTQTQAVDVAVKQNTAYLLTDEELNAIDISTPQLPEELGKVTFLDTTNSEVRRTIGISGSKAYITRPPQKLTVIDVQNPHQPQIISSIPTADTPYNSAISGDYLYVAEIHSGVQIYDVSHTPPVSVGAIDTLPAVAVHIEDTLLFVAEGVRLSIYNISNPLNPVEEGHTELPGGATFIDLAYASSFLYLAYGTNLDMFDVSDPKHPVLAGYRRGYQASGPAVKERLIFSPNGLSGLDILQNDLLTSIKRDDQSPSVTNFKLYQNYPNPFNAQTIICYDIPKTSHVQLSIYNILGEKVATLVNEAQKQGSYEIIFDAWKFSSGIYFYELQLDNMKQVKKALLLK